MRFLDVPTLGFGTYRIVGPECEQIVRLALEVGYRHIDTGQIYGNQVEIGRAIKGYPRDRLFLTSKLWLGDYTRERVPAACDKILTELQTDYVDLLLIHWPDRSVPIAETLEAMAALQQAGKVHSLGVSNFTKRHLEDAFAVGVPLVTNQVECHPFFSQEPLKQLCETHRMRLTAYSPLAKGEVAQSPTLCAIAAAHNATPAQVALRWQIQRGCIAIPKSATPERVRSNFDALALKLSSDETAQIDALNRDRRMVCPDIADFDYI